MYGGVPPFSCYHTAFQGSLQLTKDTGVSHFWGLNSERHSTVAAGGTYSRRRQTLKAWRSAFLS